MNDKLDEAVGRPQEEWIEKAETVGATTYRFSASWINELESEEHWLLYRKQQELLQNVLGDSDQILEIGVGTGFTANYLRSKGHNVITFDIDAEKKPDIVGNIVHDELPSAYDHILAFEVFEHIPYLEFLEVLRKLAPKCSKSFCLSVPIAKREFFSLEFKLPRIRRLRFALTRSLKSLWDYHFWEIGYQGMTMEKLRADLERCGFNVSGYEVFKMRAFITCVTGGN